MKKYRIKLKFRSPIHIGQKDNVFNDISKIIHSETLFSAIVNSYSLLYGIDETSKFINEITENSDLFNISSAFFYFKNKYFYPRPLGYNFGLDKKYDYKQIKKIEYVSEEFLNGEVKEPRIIGKFAVDGVCDELSKIFAMEERPRIVVDRLTNATSIYYMSGIKFFENAGLWFYLDIDERFERHVLSAIRLLSDEGIGGERTYGYGLFDLEIENVELEKEDGENFLLLSNFYPKDAKELSRLITYKLYERSGFIYSPYGLVVRQPILKFVSEGSVLNEKVSGEILDVTPGFFNVHKVYRYGRAYLIPIKKEARD